ncbi:hypothetical protein SAMN05216533_4889 [Streptomyces sp. Ag109_O5-10]|nr:hypothetical protein SAMN05216533_4889 [Streptomyces sp. Ag109_O5-10]
MPGGALGPVAGHALIRYVRTGRRPEALTPFRLDRPRR